MAEDGLSLALGLALLDLLRTAINNNRNAATALALFIEPIAALDDTATVLFATFIVNAPGDYYACAIDVVLLKSFADIQNLDQKDFEEFKGFARTRLSSFMACARELCLTGARQANFAWFEVALMTVSRDPKQWQLMSPEVQAWLSLYSDAPELSAFKRKGQDTAEEIELEFDEKRTKIKSKIEGFSDAEKVFFQRLDLVVGNLDVLSKFAFYLLAGEPLGPFSASLMNWCFSVSFNSGRDCPWQNIQHLAQFNRIDWVRTRSALLAQAKVFILTTPSTTGSYALSKVYSVTGDSEDETCAVEIRNKLRRKDLPFFGRSRLIEKLCSVDPCDPNSRLPEEIQSTSERVLAMDVGELRASRENTMELSLFNDARACLARFNRGAAISMHRELISNIVNREGQALIYGLFGINQDIALLGQKNVQILIDKRLHRSPDGLTVEDQWFISQYSLLLVFPYLDAPQQVVQLASLNEGEAILLELFHATKPMLPAQVELLIEAATKATDQNKQMALIGAARNCTGALTQRTIIQLAKLLPVAASGVRAQAYAMIAETGDADLLSAIVESGLDASNINDHNNFEARYGSSALLRAANLNLIVDTQALKRISSMSYGQAALLLGDVARSEIARRIDNAITRASHDSVMLGPDSRVHFLEGEVLESVRYDVLDSESVKPLTMEEWLDGLGNENNARERQKSRNNSHDDFRGRILQAGLGIALCPMSIEEFEFILGAAPNFRERWFHAFTVMPDAAFRLLNHLAVLLANALSHGSPALSAQIFERCKFLRASVDVRHCWSDISFVQSMLWRSARSEELDRFRFAQLNRARTDHDLAMSVLAAMMANQLPLLKAYIAEKLSSEFPSEIARAIMVIGFSDKTEQNDQRLARFHGKSGMVGKAYTAAI